MERIFDAKMCLEESRLAFAVYMLTGEAEHWWVSMKSMMEERQEPVTWDVFRRKFLSEYFLDIVKYAKRGRILAVNPGKQVCG